MSRVQSKEFESSVRRCSDELVLKELTVSARKHEYAFAPALQIVISAELGVLKGRRRCSDAEAQDVLELSRRRTSCQGQSGPVDDHASEKDLDEPSDDEFVAGVKRAALDIIKLVRRAKVRYDPLVVFASLALAFREILELVVGETDSALADVTLQTLKADTSGFAAVENDSSRAN